MEQGRDRTSLRTGLNPRGVGGNEERRVEARSYGCDVKPVECALTRVRFADPPLENGIDNDAQKRPTGTGTGTTGTTGATGTKATRGGKKKGKAEDGKGHKDVEKGTQSAEQNSGHAEPTEAEVPHEEELEEEKKSATG